MMGRYFRKARRTAGILQRRDARSLSRRPVSQPDMTFTEEWAWIGVSLALCAALFAVIAPIVIAKNAYDEWRTPDWPEECQYLSVKACTARVGYDVSGYDR